MNVCLCVCVGRMIAYAHVARARAGTTANRTYLYAFAGELSSVSFSCTLFCIRQIGICVSGASSLDCGPVVFGDFVLFELLLQ